MNGILDARRLRYFRAVAEHGSMTAAARTLNVAQPAISYHIAEIEAALGLQLLERRHDGVRVTTAGEALLRHAREVAAALEAAEQEMRDIARGVHPRRRVRIAIFTSLAADLTPAIARAFAQALPDTAPSICEASTERACRLVADGEADLAIHLGPDDGSAGGPLLHERLYFADQHHAGGKGPIALGDALDRPLVLPSVGNPLRAAVDAAAQALGRTPQLALEVDGWSARRSAVLAGLGASIAGAHALRDSATDVGLSVRPIVGPELSRPIAVSARRGLEPPFLTRARAALDAAAAELPAMIP
jgi:LysR family nitrogen assimilation transcriptional regulator